MDASQTNPPTGTTNQVPGLGRPGVERKVGLAWAALAWEGLWPRLVPLLAFVALFVAAAHLDLFAGLDPWVHTGVLAALALALVGLGWWRLRDFSWPAREAAVRRLERDSGIPHRPLVAVQDRLASGSTDPMSAALWEAHRRREAERLASLSNRAAHPGLAVLDNFSKYDGDIFHSARLKGLKPKEAITFFADSYVTYYENYPAITAMTQIYGVLSHEPDFVPKIHSILNGRKSFLKKVIEEGQKVGELKTDANSDILADIIIGTFTAICLSWRLNAGNFSLREKTLSALDMLLAAFSPLADKEEKS